LYVDSRRVKVKDVLENWLKSRRLKPVAKRTFESYRKTCDLYLIPALGELPIASLTTKHIEDAMESWKSSRKDKRSGELSATTIRYVVRMLRMALTKAQNDNLIIPNRAATVTLPDATEFQPSPLTVEQFVRLLHDAEGTDLWLPIIVLGLCGLRRGELLALRWGDFDLEAQTVTVRRAVEVDRLEGYRLGFKVPKGKRDRTVAVPPIAMEELKTYAEAQKVRLRSAALSIIQTDETLVFDRDGEIWNPDAFGRQFVDLVARSGIPRIRLHDLRHSYGAILTGLGVSDRVRQAMLGHKTAAMTTHYSAVSLDLQKSAAASVDDAMRNALKAL